MIWTNANIICGKFSKDSISCQHSIDSLWSCNNVLQCSNRLSNYTEMQLHAVKGRNMQTGKATLDSIMTHLWVPSSTGNTGTGGGKRRRGWGRRGRRGGRWTGTLLRRSWEGQVLCYRRWGGEGGRGDVRGIGCGLAFGGRGWQIIIQWRRRRGWEVWQKWGGLIG